MPDHNIVLITGTSSGIGKGLLDYYYRQGKKIICVNHRSIPGAPEAYPQAQFHVVDISSITEVRALLKKLTQIKLLPTLFILNAGINRPDNLLEGFDYEAYTAVLGTNLHGVFTFIAAAGELKLQGRTFLGISSTSNIVPNPGHFAYYLSKWGILTGFRFLQMRDPKNFYKSVVLGPLQSQIMRDYTGPQGLQGKLLRFLSGTVEDFVPVLTRFADGRRAVLYYPLHVCIFYWGAQLLLKLWPSLYSGTISSGQPR